MSGMSMRRQNLEDYELVVFDLDGTLYFQKPFRRRMLLFLTSYFIRHPKSLKDIFIVKEYREVREKWETIALEQSDLLSHTDEIKELEDSLDELQYAYVAKKKNTSIDRVRKAIQFFMMEAPLSLLPYYRDEKLIQIIEQLSKNGKQIAVYSDYPVEDKLKVLSVECKHQYTSSDERINSMKPDPQGLQVIMKDFGMQPDEICMVGDRMEKDGEAAKANGIDYLILSSKKEDRKYPSQYISI